MALEFATVALMVQTPVLEEALNAPSARSWGPHTNEAGGPIITLSIHRRELANYCDLLMRRAGWQTTHQNQSSNLKDAQK